MLVSNGCSGSTFLFGLFNRLMWLHGIRATRYNNTDEILDPRFTQLRGGLPAGEYLGSVRRKTRGRLSFKTFLSRDLSPAQANATLHAFAREKVRVWAAYRCNTLDRAACLVRNCFGGKGNWTWALGHPVDGKGNADKQCFGMRRESANRTYAVLRLINRASQNTTSTTFNRVGTCGSAWERDRDLLQRGSLRLPARAKWYEDLVAFEYAGELMLGATAYPDERSPMERSVNAWSEVLGDVGVTAQRPALRQLLLMLRCERRNSTRQMQILRNPYMKVDVPTGATGCKGLAPPASADVIWNAKRVHETIMASGDPSTRSMWRKMQTIAG